MNNYFKSINRKLSDTQEQLYLLENLGTDSIEYRLNHPQMKRRLQELNNIKKGLEESYHSERINLTISGERVGAGTIDIRTLSSFTNVFQNMIDSIASSIRGYSERGRFATEVLKQTNLTLVNVFEGSFGMSLEAGFDDVLLDEPLIVKSLNAFFDLLQSSDDDTLILEAFTKYDCRVLGYYKSFLKTISTQELTIKLDRKDRYSEQHSWAINNDKATIVLKRLQNLTIESVDIEEKKCKINSFNIRTSSFEAETQNGELISGRGNEDVILKYKKYLGEEVVLLLKKSTLKNLSTDEEKITWTLENISLDI